MEAKVWPPALPAVEETFPTTVECVPISLSRDLADIMKAVERLCKKQERLETRLDVMFTGVTPRLENRLDALLSSILECLNKNLDAGGHQRLAGEGTTVRSALQAQASTRARGESPRPTPRELSDSHTSTEYIPTPRTGSTYLTPRIELNCSKPVFHHMSPLLNSEKLCMLAEDRQGGSSSGVDASLLGGQAIQVDASTWKDVEQRGPTDNLLDLGPDVYGKMAEECNQADVATAGGAAGSRSRSVVRVKSQLEDMDASKKAEEIMKQMNALDPTGRLKKNRGMPQIGRSSMMQHSQTEEGQQGIMGLLDLILLHPAFDTTCAFMIMANSLLIGIITQWLTSHDEEAMWMQMCSHFCSLFFLFELTLRMFYQGRFYFLSDDWLWNTFDFALVGFSVVDFIMEVTQQTGNTSVGSGMKIIKMLRIVRIFRVFRFFRELALLALMIVDSIRSLLWALVTLFIIMYVFSICFTSLATEYLKSHAPMSPLSDNSGLGNPAWHVEKRFGSMGRALDSLVQSMLGGVSWGEVSEPLFDTGYITGSLFFFYIFFTMLAVLNIITGVFVDNAVETAKSQREFLVQKEMELKEKYLGEMRDLFNSIDKDGSGQITIDEIKEHFADIRVRTYFQVLGMDPDDIERLFKLIDQDSSGEVEVQEFLDGCLRLKGEARSIDLHTVMYDAKACLAKVNALIEHFDVSRETLRKTKVDCDVAGACSYTPSALVSQMLDSDDGNGSRAVSARGRSKKAGGQTGTQERQSYAFAPADVD